MTGDISRVGEMNTVVESYFPRFFECFDGGWGQVRELVHGVEAGKVNRYVRTELLDNPTRHTVNFSFVVVQGGNGQHDHLEPDPRVLDPLQGLEHRFQMGRAGVPVE